MQVHIIAAAAAALIIMTRKAGKRMRERKELGAFRPYYKSWAEDGKILVGGWLNVMCSQAAGEAFESNAVVR